MDYFSKSDAGRVKADVEAVFPGYKISFMHDPDDESVILVRLYDVAEKDIRAFRDRLYDVLDREGQGLNLELIPSIVSSENTQKYYSEYLRTEVHIDEEVFGLLARVVRVNEAGLRYPQDAGCSRWSTSKSVVSTELEGTNGYRIAA